MTPRGNWNGGKMPVQAFAGTLVAHGGSRAAICKSRRLTPGSSMVVTNVWRSMWG